MRFIRQRCQHSKSAHCWLSSSFITHVYNLTLTLYSLRLEGCGIEQAPHSDVEQLCYVRQCGSEEKGKRPDRKWQVYSHHRTQTPKFDTRQWQISVGTSRGRKFTADGIKGGWRWSFLIISIYGDSRSNFLGESKRVYRNVVMNFYSSTFVWFFVIRRPPGRD